MPVVPDGQVLQSGNVPVVPDGQVVCVQMPSLTGGGYAVIVQVLLQLFTPKAVRVIDVPQTFSVKGCEHVVPTDGDIDGGVALQTVCVPSEHTCLVPVFVCPQAFVLDVQLYVVQVVVGGVDVGVGQVPVVWHEVGGVTV